MMLKPQIAVRYKYVLLFGIFCIVIGAGIIPLSHSTAEHRRHAMRNHKVFK
jgi:hypothetical protein